MSEEKIKVLANQKKSLKDLSTLFSTLGFTKIVYSKEVLTVEKAKGQDLKGKPYLEYRVELKPASIDLTYSVPTNRSKIARLIELMPTFLDVLQVAEEYYEIKPSNIYSEVNVVLNEANKVIDRDASEFSTQLSDLVSRYNDLQAKYNDLVRSSEANTRILLECEQKRDELEKRAAKLTGMNDELLKETLYEWIKVHSGTMDVREFAKANSVALTRAEDGLNMLIQEGFIKRLVQ